MDSYLTTYFRCPEQYARFERIETLPITSGYFRLGHDITCFGQYCGHGTALSPRSALHDASGDISIDNGKVNLPFDPSEIVDNLHREMYVGEWRNGFLSNLTKPYYFIRPMLPVGVRRHLQRFYLRDWSKLPFPRWPVDCSVDNLLEQMMLLALKANGNQRIPFIWFWPKQYSSCAIMTHDVETEIGRDFCPTLMDMDESFGIKASFQVIPEDRYGVSPELLDDLRRRGFEVVIHDLNHDGHLYKSREQFLERAARINSYGKQYRAEGFRAGVLYRKQLWYDALEFAYDMSVPNVAHLDPQRGGCCTVMPYFLGHILEIPVTTIQDYTLFQILNDFSIEIWKQQTDTIMRKHGIMSFIIHPDYVIESRERKVYLALLQHLAELRQNHDVWITTPGNVNGWWRKRAKMKMVPTPTGWGIDGPGSEQARVAYASEKNGRLVFESEGSLERPQDADLLQIVDYRNSCSEK